MNIKLSTSQLNASTFPWVLYFMALLPVMLFRDFTPRNELRYLTIVDEALRNGHFWSFTFEGQPYADKPPLYFWLLMLARCIFGKHINVIICMFSFLPALGIIHIMQKWCRQLFSSSSDDAKLCLLVLSTLGLQLGLAVFARMDMLMSLFIVWSLYLYWISSDKGCAHNRWLFGILLFLALFSKGPYGILIPLVSTLTWAIVSRNLNVWLQMWGWRTWLTLVAGCTLWFGMVYQEGGGEYLNNMLFHQTVDRAVNAFHHKRAWWFYIAHIWYTTLPWGPLCLAGICHWIYISIKNRHVEPTLQSYFACGFLSCLVLLSCISGKLDVYLLPVYPFLAYGGMLQVMRWRWFSNKWRSNIFRFCYTLLAIIFVGGLLLPFISEYF